MSYNDIDFMWRLGDLDWHCFLLCGPSVSSRRETLLWSVELVFSYTLHVVILRDSNHGNSFEPPTAWQLFLIIYNREQQRDLLRVAVHLRTRHVFIGCSSSWSSCEGETKVVSFLVYPENDRSNLFGKTRGANPKWESKKENRKISKRSQDTPS